MRHIFLSNFHTYLENFALQKYRPSVALSRDDRQLVSMQELKIFGRANLKLDIENNSLREQ